MRDHLIVKLLICYWWISITNFLASNNFLQTPLNHYPLNGDLYFFMLAGIIIAIVIFYDDLKEMPPFLKLLMQVFVFFIISFTDNILINSFHGLFGIYEIGYYRISNFFFICIK